MSVTLQVDVARSAEGCHSKSDPHGDDDNGDGTAARLTVLLSYVGTLSRVCFDLDDCEDT